MPGTQVTKRSFDQVKVGMKKAEVEKILGAPGWYISERTKQKAFVSSFIWFIPKNALSWVGDRFGECENIWIVFDGNGCVMNKEYFKGIHAGLSHLPGESD